jgi:hypothetical protein
MEFRRKNLGEPQRAPLLLARLCHSHPRKQATRLEASRVLDHENTAPAHSQWGSVIQMGGLLAKIADIACEIFRGGREIEARANSAAAGALVHLEGVRDAPPGDSSEYRDEKGYLGGDLKKLTLAAGERPGKFKDEPRAGRKDRPAMASAG